MWVLRKFVDPDARFHFIEPYSHFRFGTAFDIPEAEDRRSASRSVTEVMLARESIKKTEKLKLLGRMANLFEISQWMRPSDPQADEFGRRLMEATASCNGTLDATCADAGFRFLDGWYSDPWD
jgi:hypothetical protein